MQQYGWKTHGGRMPKKCRAGLCITVLLDIFSSSFFRPVAWGVNYPPGNLTGLCCIYWTTVCMVIYWMETLLATKQQAIFRFITILTANDKCKALESSRCNDFQKCKFTDWSDLQWIRSHITLLYTTTWLFLFLPHSVPLNAQFYSCRDSNQFLKGRLIAKVLRYILAC